MILKINQKLYFNQPFSIKAERDKLIYDVGNGPEQVDFEIPNDNIPQFANNLIIVNIDQYNVLDLDEIIKQIDINFGS